MKLNTILKESGDTQNLKLFLKQLIMGIKEEKEHTDNITERCQIALDHLKEDPEYYTKLKKAGI